MYTIPYISIDVHQIAMNLMRNKVLQTKLVLNQLLMLNKVKETGQLRQLLHPLII